MTLRSLRHTLDRRSALAAFAVLTVGILVTAAAVASYPRATQSPPPTAGTSASSNDEGIPSRREFSPLRYAVVLVLLAGGAALALHLKGHAKGRHHASAIQTIAKENVGSGQQLRLVQVDGERILVGITAHHMTVLHKSCAVDAETNFEDVLSAEELRRSA